MKRKKHTPKDIFKLLLTFATLTALSSCSGGISGADLVSDKPVIIPIEDDLINPTPAPPVEEDPVTPVPDPSPTPPQDELDDPIDDDPIPTPTPPPSPTPSPTPPVDEGDKFLNDSVHDVHVRSDDKVVIAGRFTRYFDTPVGRFLRLNADGSIDPSCNFSEFNNTVFSIVELHDQSVVAVGNFTRYGNITVKNIAKLKADCTLDTSFHNNPDTDQFLTTITTQGNKLLVGGYFGHYDQYNQGGLVRLLNNGTVDHSFNPRQGDLDLGPSLTIYVQDDQSILVSGAPSFFQGNRIGHLYKLTPDGNFDNAFYAGQGPISGSKGLINNPVDIIEAPCFDTSDPTCKNIVTVGAISWHTDQNNVVTEYDGIATLKQDGNVAPGFFSQFDGVIHTGYQVMHQVQTNKLIMAGAMVEIYGVQVHGIIRLDLDGQLDPTFHTHQNRGFSFGGSASDGTIARALDVQSDGKMIVGGIFSHYDGHESHHLVRMDQNGVVDTSFGLRP